MSQSDIVFSLPNSPSTYQAIIKNKFEYILQS